ncbi:MAG: Xaa-Pro dipeptidase [Chloroflexota bacterium]|jgi:Xaa-Pro aminopeptidase|nr:Xaa-Pro dipeptidase [Chloroflexota bacterium]
MAEHVEMPRFSQNERDQRWARVREAMAAREIAVIVTYAHSGHNQQWEADSRYLSHCGGGGSSTACVFPLDGHPTVIVLNRPEFWSAAQDWIADVRPAGWVWSNPIISRLRELGIDREKIGISSLTGNLRAREGTMTHTQHEALRAAFPNATFEDVSLMMGELRAVKSPEEIAVLEKATQITEAGVHGMVEAARPGVRDYEVHAALYYAMMKQGCEVPTMVIYGSGPFPTHDAFVPTHRTLQRGDMLANEIEGKWMGYSAQRVQPVVLGDPPPGALNTMDKQRTVFNAALERLKPGTRFGEIATYMEEVAQELNAKVNLTMHGRGLGEDRPMLVGGALTPDVANFVLQEGNVFIMKPNVRPADGPGLTWGDTVLVTANGGRRLGSDKQELVVIPC